MGETEDRKILGLEQQEVFLMLGETRSLKVGQNVQLLEQFSFPICHDASYPELTKTCIYQQTAEDNFQQHCAPRKVAKDCFKSLELNVLLISL